MSKIIVLQGIPASGKTTWAKKFIDKYEHNKWVRVNRDDIRKMLSAKWCVNIEYIVKKAEEQIIINSIKSGYNIIIDDTNLDNSTCDKYKLMAKDLKCDIEFKRFYIDTHTAILRDARRKNPVGVKVIEDMYVKYLNLK